MKANFEARDLDTPAQFEVQEKETLVPVYKGPDRRKKERRTTEDRRKEVRFDLNRSDRRQSTGRRREDRVIYR